MFAALGMCVTVMMREEYSASVREEASWRGAAMVADLRALGTEGLSVTYATLQPSMVCHSRSFQ